MKEELLKLTVDELIQMLNENIQKSQSEVPVLDLFNTDKSVNPKFPQTA